MATMSAAARRAGLTERQHEFLRRLAFWEAGEEHPRPCWVGRAARNTWLLIAPTMYGTYEGNEMWHGSKVLTVLEKSGLITYGPDRNLPADVARGAITWGSTVFLTDAGRDLVRAARTAASDAEVFALGRLTSGDPQTAAEVAAFSGQANPGNTRHVLDRLVDKGLATTSSDGPAQTWTITDAGRAVHTHETRTS